jgi:hypothetical protein
MLGDELIEEISRVEDAISVRAQINTDSRLRTSLNKRI